MDDKVQFEVADLETIPCKNCMYKGFGALSRNCLKYKVKPSDVYWESANCPKFKRLEKKSHK